MIKSLKYLYLPAFVLMLSAGLASTSFAEDSAKAASVKAEKHAHGPHHAKGDMKGPGSRHHGPGMMFDDADIDKVEKMSAEERQKYFETRRAEFKKMSPDERKALHDKRKAWFDNLPEDKKKAALERNKTFREKLKAEGKARYEAMSPEEKEKFKADMKDRREAFKKERKEAFDKMTPEEKEKFKERFKDRKGPKPHRDHGPEERPEGDGPL